VPSRWVPVAGSGMGGTQSRLGSVAATVWSRRAALWVVQFVLCFLLICIIVVAVPLVCCSAKLPLSRLTGFCLFLSILLHTPAGGGAAAWRFFCRPQPNHNTHLQVSFQILQHFQTSQAKLVLPDSINFCDIFSSPFVLVLVKTEVILFEWVFLTAEFFYVTAFF